MQSFSLGCQSTATATVQHRSWAPPAHPALHAVSPHALLCISFKEFIRSQYLHLLQMVNRQHGTRSFPWMGKDSQSQLLTTTPLPESTGQLPSSLAAGGCPSFHSQDKSQQTPPLLKIRASRSPDNKRDGWEKGCKRSEATAPAAGSKSTLLTFGSHRSGSRQCCP